MIMLREKLLSLIADAIQSRNVPADAAMGKTRGWDSMSQVRIMLDLEEKFGVEIPSDQFAELTSIARIEEFLKASDALDG